MSMKVITLELARNPGHPDGDPAHGYIFRVPLDDKGYLNRYAWAANKDLCTVRRLEKGVEVEAGLLILNSRGKWVFSYAPGDEDDETLFRLAGHRFVPNEYISVTEHDGVERTFKVKSVQKWHPDPTAAATVTARL